MFPTEHPNLDQFTLDLLHHVTGHHWQVDPNTGEFFVPRAARAPPFALNPNAPTFTPSSMQPPGPMQFEYAHTDFLVRRQLAHVNPLPAPHYLSPSEQLNPSFWPQPIRATMTNEDTTTNATTDVDEFHVGAFHAPVEVIPPVATTVCTLSALSILQASLPFHTKSTMCCHKLLVPNDYSARQVELANSSPNGKNGDKEQVQNLHPHMSTKCVTLLSTFHHLVVSKS
jgi:hypothetical protein